MSEDFPRDLPAESAEDACQAAAENRRRLLRALPPDAAFVLVGRDDAVRNHDVLHPFRQDSDFLFLTAHDQPRTRLLACDRRFTLFVEVADERRRVWLGDLETPDDLRRRLGLDRVLPLDRFADELGRVARRVPTLYVRPADLPRLPLPPPRAGVGRARLRPRPAATTARTDTRALPAALRELRAFKTDLEIKLLRAAAAAGDDAFLDLARALRPGMTEYELAARFSYRLACSRAVPSFETIVAAGPGAAVLHYTRHDRRLIPGDLVLVDAGAEVRGYASDLTRTFPATGRFTRDQALIYDAVLDAHHAAVAALRPGATFAALNRAAKIPLARALRALDLLRMNNPEQAVDDGLLDLFMPHGVSHDLGLDVHDRSPLPPGALPDDRGRARHHPLAEGRVLTVEPGLYFMPALLRNPVARKKWKKALDLPRLDGWLDFGGVRLEDDYLLAPDGPVALTRFPKDRAELRRIMI